MRKTLKFLAVVAAMTAIATTWTMAQAAPAAGAERKVSARVAPVYPELAKRMHIHGIVRIEAIVRTISMLMPTNNKITRLPMAITNRPS